MKSTLRPPAVPLITIDPYFSVWSTADRLTDDFTRHWTGRRNALTGLIRIDGKTLRFIGKVEPNAEGYFTEPEPMHQTSLHVTALSTVYVFEAEGVCLKAHFTSPLLLDDFELLSRPASYLKLSVSSLDGKAHEVQVYLDVTGEWCVDTSDQEVVGKTESERVYTLLQFQNAVQNPLSRSGDDIRIDWGDFYLATESGESVDSGFGLVGNRMDFVRQGTANLSESASEPRAVRDQTPMMAFVWNCGELPVSGKEISKLYVLAYNDKVSIEYFGNRLKGLWTRSGTSASAMIAAAFLEYPSIMERCDAFDRMIREKGEQAGGKSYADLLDLVYRQAIAAHKLVEDKEGNLLFLSKECFSNGCVATVDVSYPSMPLFLLFAPELVRGMMRPIFKFAASDLWKFEFAPHDIGQYPLANGQVYGMESEAGQMPIEECGNMLIMMAAVCKAEQSTAFAEEHWDVLTKWVNYLLKHGLDPENQLCTDDFAGHLAHNANLSIKAIMGIASYGILCGMRGDKEQERHFRSLAREMAGEWIKLAKEGDHYQLAFGSEGSWSLKYNLVWDQLFRADIFPEEVARKEVAWYLQQQDRYGVPLDSREHYTKADWLIWAASLAEREEDFKSLIEPLWFYANETPDRKPLTDWCDTLNARWINFQHRSVVGGFFIQILKKEWVKG
ncbi:glutaminase family protein [Cohnella yongneupensis]|uniref:Glutaminase domain-containing protein n=1 Tax=Cohnella yongneupensis TaxID=425006 RepID=A0ABW0QZS7_9BACL